MVPEKLSPYWEGGGLNPGPLGHEPSALTTRPAFLNPNCSATRYFHDLKFYWIFLNFIEGRDPLKIFHDPLPGRDPVVEKPCTRPRLFASPYLIFVSNFYLIPQRKNFRRLLSDRALGLGQGLSLVRVCHDAIDAAAHRRW
jgi:hypothetical protein